MIGRRQAVWVVTHQVWNDRSDAPFLVVEHDRCATGFTGAQFQWPILIFSVEWLALQAVTGFALVTTPIIAGTSPRDWIVGWWLGALVGSTDLAGWYMRIGHYIISWLFIIFTTIHVYLSVTEDFPAFLNFFGLGVFDREHADHGEHDDEEAHDEHGHAPSPAFTESD